VGEKMGTSSSRWAGASDQQASRQAEMNGSQWAGMSGQKEVDRRGTVTANEQRRRTERIEIGGGRFFLLPTASTKTGIDFSHSREKQALFFTFGSALGNLAWSGAEGALPNRATVLKTRFVVEILYVHQSA